MAPILNLHRIDTGGVCDQRVHELYFARDLPRRL